MNEYNNTKQYQNNDILMMTLYEKTSKAGNMYLTTTMGPCRYSLMKTKNVTDQGEPVWVMKISQAQRENASAPRPVSRPVQQTRPHDDDEDFLSEFVG